MWWVPSLATPISGQTLYEQEIEPHKDKIIWYHLRKLPEINPGQSAVERNPRAKRQNKAILISQAPAAPESSRLTWTERPKPEPRRFEAPDMISIRKRPEIARTAPELAAQAAGQAAMAQLQIPKLAPKTFVGPAPRQKPPARVPEPVTVSDAPTLTEPPKPVGWDQSLSAIAAASGVRAPKPFTAPQAKKPGAHEGAGTVPQIAEAPAIAAAGASDINALAVNTLRPTLPADLPPASDSQVSAGPRPGERANPPGSGLRIPGITVQPGSRAGTPNGRAATARPEPPPFVAAAVAPLQQTFSAPLAPSARSIPAAIEARFHQRVVYTVVLPMRKVPGYSADWIMWFAERDPQSGPPGQIQMRAPLPVRKTYRAGAAELAGRIQVAATIDRNGNIAGISQIGTGTGLNIQAVTDDLEAWEFLPALRNRLPIDTDIVLEITFGGTARAAGIRGFASTAVN